MEKFVLIADSIDKICSQTLQEKYGLTVVYHPDINIKFIKNLIDRYDGLIVRSRTNVDKQMIERGAKGIVEFQKGCLKVIGRAGIGLDNIDLEAAKEFDVKVFNVADGHIPSVAEHTIGLMIALSRDLISACNSTHNGNWEKSKFKGNELHGKTLGIIGYGQIGQRVATIANAIGMEILIHDPHVQKNSSFDDFDNFDELEFVSLKLMFKMCDLITLHVPLNSDTEKMVNSKLLNIAKKNLRLINTSRGKVIDEDALYKVIYNGTILGAALDVFSIEPPIGAPLLRLSNVIATPHISSSTVEAQYRIAKTIANKIGIYLTKGEQQ